MAWVLDLEQKIGDLSVAIGEVDLWPIIRNSVILALLDESGPAWPGRKHPSGKMARFFHSLRSFFKVKRTDLVFVTDTKYSERIQGQYFIKDVDGVAGLEENNGKSMTIALYDKADRPLSRDADILVSLYAIKGIALILARLRAKLPLPKKLTVLLNIVSEAASETGNLRISRDQLKKQLLRNIMFSVMACKLFGVWLNKAQPEKVFIHCYYSPLGMALCAACKSRGIEIVDVQHGLAGRNMRAYGQWRNSPKGGFSTMPAKFLSWTEADAAAINEWSEAVGLGNIAFNSGQLWLRYFYQSGLSERARDEWRRFLNEIKCFKKRLVITLQFPEIDKNILELIVNSEKDICFLIRAHPNSLGSQMPERLADIAFKNENVFIFEPTLIPIGLILEVSDLNITGWSASVYESYFVGVSSLITSRIGESYFDHLELQNYIINVSSYEEIKDKL